MTSLTRRDALERFAALTLAAWAGTAPTAFAAPPRHLTAANARTYRALARAYRVPVRRARVGRLKVRMARRGDRYARWVNLVLETLEHAPERGRFSELSVAERRRELRRWWALPDANDVAVPDVAPRSLGAANRAARAAIAAGRRAGYVPSVPAQDRAPDGPLDTDVRRLRHLRGCAEDLVKGERTWRR